MCLLARDYSTVYFKLNTIAYKNQKNQQYILL